MRVCRYFLITLLILSLVSLAFINLAVAQQKATSVIVYNNIQDYQKATGKKIDKFNEAPMLADLVKQGKLPPVEQRLPQEPLVVAPLEEIGQYGGTWRRAAVGVSDVGIINSRITYENLVRWSADGKKVVPNVATKWKIEDGGKTFTFYLRKGIKWSDGQPFTAEDIVFWYKEVLLNKDLTPTVATWLTAGGKPCKIEKVDTYTFRVSFEQPNPLFLINICKSGGNQFFLPKHYGKQFHIKYAPKEELEKKVKDAGFQFWYQLFDAKVSNSNAWLQNPELPVLQPWRNTTLPTATTMIFERNPYYWKIDPAGNQLPYIDRIAHTLVENREVITMKAVSGEIDMQTRHISLPDYTLLMENRAKGNYRVLNWKQGVGSDVMICLNQNVKDPVLRKIFEDRRFRQALSIAINRDEIWKLIYLGMGKPRQCSLISGVAFYDPEWEKMWAEYDPKKANELLDKIGLNKRDRDGFRLRPDGKTLALTITFPSGIFGLSGMILLGHLRMPDQSSSSSSSSN
jgi:peptide/nickel transport system substrate-binding protein